MRQLSILVVVLAITACGDNKNGPLPDGPKPDAPITAGIAEARAAGDGTGLSLPINNVVVTYLKPQVGNPMNDPAGFTIQASQTSPALVVSVDPATLTPPPAVGDTVSFTITEMGTIGMQRRALAITNFSRGATGADVGALAQDISAATDLVSALDNYDSELVTVSGTLFENFKSSGTGFQRAGISTGGISNDTNLQLRVPAELVDALDMAKDCHITATNIPFGRFNAQAQLGVFTASDFTMSGCAAPTVASVVALSLTSVRVTFTRRVKASTVMADGSQFTFDHGVTASAAVVDGKTVTLTTSAQTEGTAYTATVANTVTDQQGTALGTPNSGGFSGFSQRAVVRINELNANIDAGCDLIELRVVSGGSMTGFTIKERTGGNGELNFTFPSFDVQTNDLIVVHTIATAATCNPGGATAETTAPDQQPAGTFAGNFDTAFDFWATDNGLTFSNNVITLFDATSSVHDAVFVTDGVVAAAGGTKTAAAIVGTASQWSPSQPAYDAAQFTAAAVPGLGSTGTTAGGTSIQRLDNTDENDKSDWTMTPAASTWGALNVGQTAF